MVVVDRPMDLMVRMDYDAVFGVEFDLGPVGFKLYEYVLVELLFRHWSLGVVRLDIG